MAHIQSSQPESEEQQNRSNHYTSSRMPIPFDTLFVLQTCAYNQENTSMQKKYRSSGTNSKFEIVPSRPNRSTCVCAHGAITHNLECEFREFQDLATAVRAGSVNLEMEIS